MPRPKDFSAYKDETNYVTSETHCTQSPASNIENPSQAEFLKVSVKACLSILEVASGSQAGHIMLFSLHYPIFDVTR